MWIRPLLLGITAAALCGCGAEPSATSSSVPAHWTTFRDEAAGLTGRFPSSWHRARTSLTPSLTSPRELISIGTFPLRHAAAPCAHLPVGALRRMGPRDVFVSVQESRGSTRGFPPRRRPFRLGRTDSEIAACLRRPVPFEDHWTSFRDRGRAFYVLSAVGRDASAERRRRLLAVIDGLRVAPSPGVQRMDPDESVPFEVDGISGLLPLRWRLDRRRLIAGTDGDELAFGSYAVPRRPPDRNCTPKAAIDALPPDGVFVYAFEYEDLSSRQLARFPRRPRRFGLGTARAYECFGMSHLLRWQERGRALQAHVYLGPRAGAAQRREVLAVLDALRVRRRGRG